MQISSSTSVDATQSTQRHHGGHKPPPMDNTAALLGMSTDDLQKAQKSGTSLTDLAAQKGISKDDLVASITKDMTANKPEGAPELSATQMTEMATNIADGVRPSGPPPGGMPPQQGGSSSDSDRANQNLSELASSLGTDTDTLLSKLQSGDDISSWLSSLKSATGYGSSTTSTVSGGVTLDTYA
jgi:hypothetical protein